MESVKSKLKKYSKYLSLTDKQRKQIVDDAEQDKHHSPNPQGEHTFPDKNFVEFYVADEDGKPLRLTTFRYPSREKPRALVLMFHGLNSHIGHGSHIAQAFS